MLGEKILVSLLIALIVWLIYNAISIHNFGQLDCTQPADVAIVLRAGTNNGQLSPVFRERMNHAIDLWRLKKVKLLIITGGFGENQSISDSEAAKRYAIKLGVPDSVLLIEEKSKLTIENIGEAKILMQTNKLQTALIVSDPLHMRRAMLLADHVGLKAYSSPTTTSMYRSWRSKWKFLLTETIFLTGRQIQLLFTPDTAP